MAVTSLETKCSRCDEPSVANVCPADGRAHHHGGIHSVDSGLERVCEKHAQTIADEWDAQRLLNEVVRDAAITEGGE